MNLDESISALCSITKGDLPIMIWWRFTPEDFPNSGYNLTTNDGVVITRTSKKVSTLAIEALKARHRGNYSCYASNKGGFANHSAYLAINGLTNSSLFIFKCHNLQEFCSLFEQFVYFKFCLQFYRSILERRS